MDAINAVFGRLYSVPVPDRRRTRPLQVICIGPSRSGTDSLKQALIELGYPKVFHGYETMLPSNRHQKPILSKFVAKKYHSNSQDGNITFTAEEFDQVFGEYDALTDMPCANFAPELAAAYPEAKIILNRREDVDAWYKSYDATLAANGRQWWSYIFSWFAGELYWSKRILHRDLLPSFFRGDFRANGKWIYREHCVMARSLVPRERFLEWGVEDGWEPLCEFLGKDVPKKEFPQGNMPAEFWRRVGENHEKWLRQAYWHVAVVIGGLATTFVLVKWPRSTARLAMGACGFVKKSLKG